MRTNPQHQGRTPRSANRHRLVPLIATCLFGLCGLAASQENTPAILQVSADARQKGRISMNTDNVDIVKVLNAFSMQAQRNLVIAPDVKGSVTARLQDVPWRDALDVLLTAHGYTYSEVGDTIIVSCPKPTAVGVESVVTPLATCVLHLRFLDAADVAEVIRAHLSPAGKVTVVATAAQSGWEFEAAASAGATSPGKRRRAGKTERTDRSKTLVLTDIRPVIERVTALITKIDRLPPQVMIEARFVEVESGRLKDLGVSWGSGARGAETTAVEMQHRQGGGDLFAYGAQSMHDQSIPNAFETKGSGVNPNAPYNTGLQFAFQSLTQPQFQVLLHALEEDANANVLSVPRIAAVDNQEAAIIVGTKFPIIKSEVSGQSATISTSLEYYENIGIQLNVVPQVCDTGHIRMIVHPAVTDQTGTAAARTGTGDDMPLTEYPILATREAETQVLIRSGETIVIGGLIEDQKTVSQFRVPLLGSIPLVGMLFRRQTESTRKVELVMFITATIEHAGESIETGEVTVSLPVDAAAEEHTNAVPQVTAIDTRLQPETSAEPQAAR